MTEAAAPLPCLVFPYAVADGPRNMARDEALLDLVADEPGAAAVRTYGWSEPTLSLGYFQAARDADGPRWRGAAVVRRPTGGGAIWHDRELTYALAVPRGHPLARRSGDLYRAVHGALAGLLSAYSGEVGRRGGAAPTGASRPFLCFLDRDPEDVVVGAAHKVVGSAQRRRSGAVLQHGSVLLARSPKTPELPGAADLTGAPADPRPWADLVSERVPAALGLAASPAWWTDRLETRSLAIEHEVYRNPGWARRR